MFFPTAKQRKNLERIEKFLMASQRRNALLEQDQVIKDLRRRMGTWLYTLEELSSKLKISIKTLRLYIREGKLGASKVGRRFYVTSRDIRKFLDNHRFRPKNKKAEP